jgi:hypothetical protein
MPKNPDGDWTLPADVGTLIDEWPRRYPPPAMTYLADVMLVADEDKRLRLAFRAGQAAVGEDLKAQRRDGEPHEQ